MSWKKMLFGGGLLMAGVVAQAQANPGTPPSAPAPVVTSTAPPVATPYTGRPIYSTPSGPGCLTPGHPGTLPGTIVGPGTTYPGTIPGTTPGTTPGTMPGDAGAAAGAAAAGAAVAGGGGEGGSGGLNSGAPNMIGDLGTKGVATFRSSSVSYSSSFSSSSSRVQALTASGSFKIAENESPRPQSRVFLTYNYFNGVNTFGGPNSQFDLHREVLGFEAAFLDGNASIGARLPFLQRAMASGNNTIDGIGDLSVILKYAFLNDRETGNVASGGLVITAPTGRDIRLGNGENIHDWLFQPWAGFIVGGDRVFTQGFVSAVLPLDQQDAYLLSTDLGVGYRLYQNSNGGALTAVVPTIEAHLLTPLSRRGVGDVLRGQQQVGVPDQLVITAGVHFGLWDRAWLTLAAATPVTGPRLFDFEGVIQFNYMF